MTHSLENSLNGGINQTNITGDPVDNSEYLDFVFYDKVRFNYNSCVSPSEHGRWLGISHHTRMLMRYPMVTHAVKFVSRSMAKKVTNLQLCID